MKFPISIFVLLVFVISAGNSYAKSKLIPAYLITLNNDTIHGYIEYNRWKETPTKILFKESINEISLYYTPKTISEFGTNNDIYRSAIVKINQNNYSTNKLSSSPDFQFIIDTIFLQAIILGDKDLYYLVDSTRNEKFYIKNDLGYEWLMYDKFLKKENGKEIVVENNNYIGQLLLYFKDCNSINSILSITTYKLKNLTKVFNYYYECTNSKIKYREKEDKYIIFFWLN